jgi:hypothetical protein
LNWQSRNGKHKEFPGVEAELEKILSARSPEMQQIEKMLNSAQELDEAETKQFANGQGAKLMEMLRKSFYLSIEYREDSAKSTFTDYKRLLMWEDTRAWYLVSPVYFKIGSIIRELEKEEIIEPTTAQEASRHYFANLSALCNAARDQGWGYTKRESL